MKILFIGDIFGKTGVRAAIQNVPSLIKEYDLDLVIANGENAYNGLGISPEIYHNLIKCGIDVITLGNHAFDQESILSVINSSNLIRPFNYAPTFKYAKYGYGSRIFEIKNKKVRITNLLAESLSSKYNKLINPFIAMHNLINSITTHCDIHIVDFHGEYTGEKYAFLTEFSPYLSAVIGTHTHVQTMDNRIHKGCAYITDVGMTGPHDGIIGANPAGIIKKAKGDVTNFQIEEADGHYQLNAVFIEFDDKTNRAVAIKNIFLIEKEKCHCIDD